ncbi:hypothetical protein AALO_G00216210 [Alosa alosa]|uniref:Wiskott-Aldrich syndrome protein family member n=1 Tax=Alosa alosa TaxID=278164 RepID=A0AAV6G1Q9_9TELE|nr:hypothetical protein AALO_G00216210 [Alosa alosa]
MPLVKRNIEPRHLCRGELPEGIGSELECVMNNTLSAIIRQLSSLSKHAEDIFGELFNEANTFYLRANSLQDRIDRLAIKVTQLDSTVEEVSLQDINMKKAFKSSTHQDQQVVSKSSVPIPVKEMYNLSDKPPPLNNLSCYRDDGKEGLKFYTDPSYFFDLWKEKMLQDTEDKRKERRKQKEQKRCVDGTLQREVKKVRKARNRRQEWNMMAFDKELRPDHRHTQSLHRGGSSEGSLSPENRAHAADHLDHHYPNTPNHAGHAHTYSGPPPSLMGLSGHALAGMELDPRGGPMAYRSGTLGRPHQAPPPPPPTDTLNGSVPLPPVDYSMDYMNTGPPPSSSRAPHPLSTDCLCHASSGIAPPVPSEAEPTNDARSDLLAAIRMGIQLKKVQEQQEQQAKREPVGNDVATILSRRIAVEYSDSEDDSELEDNDWSD